MRRWVAHPSRMLSLAISPDGKTLASGGGGNMSVGLWDLSTGKELRQLRGHVNWVQAVSFSSDGKRLVSGGADRVVRVWDAASGKEVSPRNAHQGPVSGVVLSPDGKTLATASWDGILRLWEVSTGRALSRLDDDPGTRWAVAFVPGDGILAASIASPERPELRLWDVASRKQLPNPPKQETVAWAFALAPGGDVLGVGNEDGTIQLWRVDKGKRLRQLWHRAVGLRSGCLAFSADGKRLITGGSSGPPAGAGLLLVWDALTGEKLHQFEGHSRPVKCLALALDNKTLASGSFGGTIRLWDGDTGREVRNLKVAGERTVVMSLAWSPDGKTIASGDSRGMVRLWEVATGKERCLPNKHQGPVNSLAFSRDGRLLATGCEDSTALIWAVDRLAEGGTAPTTELTDADLGFLWAELSDDDARTAFRAVWRLAVVPRQALSMFEGRIRPVAKVDTRRIAQLVGELDSESFLVREQAAAQLHKLGEVAEPALRRALTDKPSLELRRRAEDLLRKIQPFAAGEQLRPWRALEALELLGAPARPLLRALAKGAPEARLTQEAGAALVRVEERTGGRP